jgi:hypothetical protein
MNHVPPMPLENLDRVLVGDCIDLMHAAAPLEETWVGQSQRKHPDQQKRLNCYPDSEGRKKSWLAALTV